MRSTLADPSSIVERNGARLRRRSCSRRSMSAVIPLSALTSPELTTVRQPIREMAARSLRLLLGERPTPDTTVMLPTELIIRGSCGPPPRAEEGKAT